MDNSSQSPEEGGQASHIEKLATMSMSDTCSDDGVDGTHDKLLHNIQSDVQVDHKKLSRPVDTSRNSNTSLCIENKNTFSMNDFNGNDGGTAIQSSTRADEQIVTSNTAVLNVFTYTSEHHSKSFEETSDVTEPAEQVPSNNLLVSDEILGHMVFTTKPVTTHEKMSSDENLEVIPCNAFSPPKFIPSSAVDSEAELDKYNMQLELGTNSVTPCERSTIDLTQFGEYPVHDAVIENNIEVLQQLMELDVKLDTRRKSDGKTPLHIACYHGQAQSVKLLLLKVSNINSIDKDGNHSLHYKSALRCLTIVSLLLENFALIDPTNAQFFTPLAIVSEVGDVLIETARLLLANNASVDGSPECHTTPLLLACEKGHIGVASLLLSANADVNRKDSKTGETPVMKACFHGRMEIIRLLMDAKPNLNLVNRAGVSPITMAVVKGSLEILRVLVESGAETVDVNCTRIASDSKGHEYNVTPLCDAFIRGDIAISRYLIDHGANINTTDINNQVPDKHQGSISPLTFACMTDHDQLALVEYVVSLDQFIASLPFIADPIQEALKRGHDQSAMVLCEAYGGLEKIKEDASKAKHFELARMLNVVLTYEGDSLEHSSSDIKHCSLLSEAISAPAKCIDDKKQLDMASSSFTASHLEQLHPERDFNNSGITSHAQSGESTSLPSPDQFTILDNTEHLTNNVDNLLDSDGSTELTLGDNIKKCSTPTVMAEHVSGLEAVFNPLNELDHKVKNSVEENMELLKSVYNVSSTNTKEVLFSQLKEGAVTVSDDDNPFKSQPKTPISELSAAESDVGGFGSSVAASAMPLQLDDSGSLRLFQGSAVEVLYDFMQYLISACVQQRTPEEVIHKAEINGDTKLVHFFTRYFFDMGSIGSHQLVSEFLQGFPSPMNFIFVSNFCSKEDFLTVLKSIGREDFPDQLMLALHQFPNSDNIPWSGFGLVDALFNQTFIVGSHSSHTTEDTTSFTPHSVPSVSHDGPLTLDNEFPGGGYRLGGNAGRHESRATHVTGSVLNGNHLDSSTNVSMRTIQNDLSTDKDQSDMETDIHTRTRTIPTTEISPELSPVSLKMPMSDCQSSSHTMRVSVYQQQLEPSGPSIDIASLNLSMASRSSLVPSKTLVSSVPSGSSIPLLMSDPLGSSVTSIPLGLPLDRVVVSSGPSDSLKPSASLGPLPSTPQEVLFPLGGSAHPNPTFSQKITFTSTGMSVPSFTLNSFPAESLVNIGSSFPPGISNQYSGPPMVPESLGFPAEQIGPMISDGTVLPLLMPNSLVHPSVFGYRGQSVIPITTVPLTSSVELPGQLEPVDTLVSQVPLLLPSEPSINYSSAHTHEVFSAPLAFSAKCTSLIAQPTVRSLPPVHSSQPISSIITPYQQNPIAVVPQSGTNFVVSSSSLSMPYSLENRTAFEKYLGNERLPVLDHTANGTSVSSNGFVSSGSRQGNTIMSTTNHSEENLFKYTNGKRLKGIVSTTDSEEDVPLRNKPDIATHNIDKSRGIRLRRVSYSESDEEDPVMTAQLHNRTSLDSNRLPFESSGIYLAPMMTQPKQHSSDTMMSKVLSTRAQSQLKSNTLFSSKIPRPVRSSHLKGGSLSPKQNLKASASCLKETNGSTKNEKKLKFRSESSIKAEPQLEKSPLHPNKNQLKSVYKAPQKSNDGEIRNSTIVFERAGKEAASTKTQQHLREQLPYHSEVISNTDVLFKNLSMSIMNWKTLGRYLLITDHKIDFIAKQMATEQEQSLKILISWRNQVIAKGDTVTYMLLYDALINSRNDRLLCKLSEHYSVSSGTETFHLSHSFPLASTDDLVICVPLSKFWDNLKPFIESKRTKGFNQVTVSMKFQK